MDHNALAKSLLGLAVDIAAPGVRGRVEEIIKATRGGVIPSGSDSSQSWDIKSVLSTLAETPAFESFVRDQINSQLQSWLSNRGGDVPKVLLGLGIYGKDGRIIYGDPLMFPPNLNLVRTSRPTGIAEQPAAAVDPVTVGDSGFEFGAKSEAEFKGMKPELAAVFRSALKYSTQDFGLFDGLRTEAEQAKYVAAGTSQTMESMHRIQSDGYGHAGDLVPWVDGKYVWDWDRIYPIVLAVDLAATELGCANKIIWGGAWDRRLSDFSGDASAYKKACQDYVARRKADGHNSVFIDGPHFEWRD